MVGIRGGSGIIMEEERERELSNRVMCQLADSEGSLSGLQFFSWKARYPRSSNNSSINFSTTRSNAAFYKTKLLRFQVNAIPVSVEKVLTIVYQPEAVFCVRPVTRCSSTIAGHNEAVLSASFSPDGRHLASGSGDTTVRLWNLNARTPLFTCKGHKNWVLCIAWSPDGKHLVSGSKT